MIKISQWRSNAYSSVLRNLSNLMELFLPKYLTAFSRQLFSPKTTDFPRNVSNTIGKGSVESNLDFVSASAWRWIPRPIYWLSRFMTEVPISLIRPANLMILVYHKDLRYERGKNLKSFLKNISGLKAKYLRFIVINPTQ